MYLAEDTDLDRKVAIKVLPPGSVGDEQAKKRLVREAKAAAKLDHPNICAIHEVGEAEGQSFIVMQYVDGETLASRCQRKPLERREMLDIAVQMADGLAEAHSRGIIHRDIKPQNIMLTARGQVKVMDFGLAKVVQQQTTASEAGTESLLTEPGTVMGTVPYMSPEQVRGEILDTRSDIFSFGCVLYEMVSGRQPFASESAAATFSAILAREPQPLARYSTEVSSELERIVSKTLRKDKEERYQTIKDLLIDLKNLREELAFGAKLELAASPELSARAAIATGDRPAAVTTATESATRSGESVVRTTLSADYVVSGIKRHKRGAVLVLIALMITVAAAVYFAIGSKSKAIDSLAVLPFVNLSADPDTEYLSDGISDSLISRLSQVPNLRMIARSSVFRYKGRETDPQTVGRELSVQAVLVGRVVQRADSLSISVELVDVRDNSHLWGEQYDGKLSDLLAVQKEIAKEISEKLRVRLTGEEQKRVTKSYTDNAQAYQLYLKGRYYWSKRTEEGLKKAIEYFNQAIEKDPNYALAYAGAADCYGQLGNFYVLSPEDAFLKANAAALKALEIDDTLAEAHTSRAFASTFYQWDWSAAEREYKRAIELDPNYATAHYFYSIYLAATERFNEAISEAKRAQELDPVSPVMTSNVGWIFHFARKYDLATGQFRDAIELDPTYFRAHRLLGLSYLQKKSYEEAIAAFQKSRTLSGDSPEETAYLGYAYSVAGMRGEAQSVIDELKEQSKRRYVSPYLMALIYEGLDEKDQAFVWLEKAYEGTLGQSDLPQG